MVLNVVQCKDIDDKYEISYFDSSSTDEDYNMIDIYGQRQYFISTPQQNLLPSD